MRLVFEQFQVSYRTKHDTWDKSHEEQKATGDAWKQVGRMTKKDLVKRLVGFFNKCLRLLRAYNFD